MTLADISRPAPSAPLPVLERVHGAARIGFSDDGGTTRLAENFQSGSAKARFPKSRPGEAPQVVLLNTAGGVTDGDHLSFTVSVGPQAKAVATTQAAERIYRRREGVARVETMLTVAEGASLDWLPQETILFDRSALKRTLTADVHATGRLLAVETILLGRTAMGEQIRNASLADSWRIRRGGKLAFADGIRFDGDSVAILNNGATGGGAIALATLALIAPDAEASIETARTALAEAKCEAGASAWNGMLVARLAAREGHTLRADLIRLIEALRQATMPGNWLC
jgi:urease accessory protein